MRTLKKGERQHTNMLVACDFHKLMSLKSTINLSRSAAGGLGEHIVMDPAEQGRRSILQVSEGPTVHPLKLLQPAAHAHLADVA